MRTRTIWLAWLLVAGMALTPRGGVAQEVPQPDPVWPLPLGHDRLETGGFYAFGEFVMFRQTNPIKSQVIAVRGFVDTPGLFPIIEPGTFFGSGDTALDAQQVSGPRTYQPGFEIGAGWRFRDGSAIELSWMHLVKAEYGAVASTIPPNYQPGTLLVDTVLFSPVVNFPPEYAGPPEIGYGIWNFAEVMSISFLQRTEQIQAKFRVPVWETDCYRCYGLAGARFFWIWERFKWRTADYINGSSQITSPFNVALYTNIVSNRMYGPFIGFGQEYYVGHGFSVSLDLEAAVLLDVVKERAKYELGEKNAPPQSKRARTEYEVVPELSAAAKIWWYPIEGVQIQVGYDFMAFFNTIAGERPVSFNYGAMDPPWSHVSRYFDGFRAGIGFIF